MDIEVFLIVLFSTVMHAVWNAMVKNHSNKTIAVSAIVLGHVPLSVVAIFLLPLPSFESVPYILASIIIHQCYQWYLINSYEVGDFTKVYPIARGFGPLVATLISVLILGIVLNSFVMISIFVLCFGIMMLGILDKESKNTKVLSYSLFTGFFIGMYSLTDGYGARISNSAVSYISWSFLINALIFPIVLRFKNQKNIFLKIIKEGKIVFWIGGSLSFIIYAIVVWAFTKAPIPMVSALRETSILFSIIIGYFFLKEKITIIKIISVLFIIFGVIGLKLF